MSKCILAFLAVAATAVGQDTVLEDVHRSGVSKADRQSFGEDYGRWTIGTVGRATDGYEGYRRWHEYDLSDVGDEVQSAFLEFTVTSVHVMGRPPHHESLFVVVHDSEPEEAVVFNTFLPTDTARDIWNDLGSGAFYGTADISKMSLDGWEEDRQLDSGRTVSWWRFKQEFETRLRVPLSPLAIRDINAARREHWFIGVSLPELAIQHEPIDWPFVKMERTLLDSEDWDLHLIYGPAPPLGDFSGNGRVDQGDLDAVLLRWGLMDQEELDAVLLTWGLASPATASAIPEPSTMPLAAACVILAAGGRIWKRRR